MDLTFVTDNNCKPQTCRGFALVVALSLMAFMLVLVVTLLSLMEVETRSAGNNLELQKAREGARMALGMAIGQLQEYAGDDERVTARADITGVAVNRENHWTGVWDTDVTPNPATTTDPPFIGWLVSGTNPQPTNALDDDNSLELVGRESVNDDGVVDTDDYVRAPFVNVLDKNGNVTSRIAWWTSDEGIKTSVGEVPLTPAGGRPNPNYISNVSLNSMQTMLSSSQGIEEIFTDYDRFTNYDSSTDTGNAKNLGRVSSLDQLPDLNDFSDSDNWNFTNGSVTEDFFHTVTPCSLGLLTSTRGSGLMQDLSLFPELIDGQFANIVNNAASTAIANESNAANSIPALRHNASIISGINTIDEGDISNFVTPVITNFMLAFAIFETDNGTSDLNPLLRMQFFCELWNPYTSFIPTLQDDDARYYELQITGLPTVAIQLSGGATGTSIDLQDRLCDTSKSNNPLVIELKYYDDDPTEAWFPGMTKNWTGVTAGINSTDSPSPVLGRSPYISRQTRTKIWNASTQTLGGDRGFSLSGIMRVSSAPASESDPLDQISVVSVPSTDGSTINVRLYLVNETAPPNLRRTLLTQINGVNYDPINVPAFRIVDSSSFDRNEVRFGYHFILKGPHHSNDDTEYTRGRWLHDNDPRNPSPTLSGTTPAYAPVVDGITAQVAPIPPHNLTASTISIEEPRRLCDRSNDLSSGSVFDSDYFAIWQDVPLFEIPRERILSLASLQHLYFHGERPFRVGNSWGRSGNFGNDSENTLEWFDKYYFSGLSKDDDPDAYVFGDGLPNPIIYPYGFTDPAVTADTTLHPNTLISGWLGTSSNIDITARQLAGLSMVINRFNFNSTSVAAWKAVLSGLRIHSWRYVNETPEDRSSAVFATMSATESFGNRKSMFSRFSHSLQETYNAPQTPGNSLTFADTEYYRRGARYLTDDQITSLAESIVSQLQTKRSPFISVEEFLADPSNGSGVLEQAIAAVLVSGGQQQWDRSWETLGTGADNSTDVIPIDHFSPGFLTQADIMTAIGPMLAPRSDTFKIRARCQTLSPFNSNEVIGDATIEAVVQRVPDPADPGDNINDSINRKFKIMSVRWLTADEI